MQTIVGLICAMVSVIPLGWTCVPLNPMYNPLLKSGWADFKFESDKVSDKNLAFSSLLIFYDF